MIKFYDTNALLELQESVFSEMFMISSESLIELENIKVAKNKDEDVKFAARRMSRMLADKEGLYEVIQFETKMLEEIEKHYGIEPTPDVRICYSAKCSEGLFPGKDVLFVTDDISCRNIARNIFGLTVKGSHISVEKDYSGYMDVRLSDESMAKMYEDMSENPFGLLAEEYLIVRNEDGELVDRLCWTGENLVSLSNKGLKSTWFGTIKPKDVYQQMAIDSFNRNQITMVRGKAGAGKSLLALGYLFSLLENHKIQKIVVFCNTPKTANSVGLGFYPGSRNEKLLDSSVGSMLSAKLGSAMALDQLIAQGKIELMPLADIRGYDTSNMQAGVYISEAQNMDIELMKLALQRIGEDSVVIIDGDYNTQVDMPQYGGERNGMRRMSEVFRGQPFYGEVELQNIYRSKIAMIADKM